MVKTEVSAKSAGFVESDISTWTEDDYRCLLGEVEAVFNAPEGTPESARCDVLFDLIEAYEAEHYPMDQPALKPKHGVLARV